MRAREVVFAVAMGGLAAGGAALVLDGSNDGFSNAAVSVTQSEEERTYQLTGFERISTSGPQDIQISYGEAFSVRSEGPTGELEVNVVDGELVIGPQNGFGPNWRRLQSTTFFVTMPRLTRLSLNGSGDIHVEQLKGERFVGVINGGFGGGFEIDALEVDEAEFTVNGPGEISASGVARSTRVTLNGPAEFQAGDLRSQLAVIAVRGPGDVELAVEQEADVSVQGPGEVDIDGPARCTVTTSGPGSVNCGNRD